MRATFKILLQIILAILILSMAACDTTDSDSEPDGRLDLNNLQANAPEGTYQAEPIDPAYVGEVDSDLFIGISIESDADTGEPQEVLIYLCDGNYVSHWFSGEVDASGSGTFASEDEFEISIELETAGGDLSGTVAFGDESQQSFTATAASGDDGLYRAEETFDGEDYIAGWIVLQDGRQLGSKTVCFSRHPRTGRRMCVSVK